MPRFKSVAFDTDGTLVDSDALHHKAFNDVLLQAGLPSIGWEKYLLEGWISYSDRDFFEKYAARLGPSQKLDVPRLIKQKEAATSTALDHADIKLFKSVKELIFHLTDDLAVPIFEVTGATADETQRYFQRYPGLKEKFSALVSASDEHIPGKPDPQGYQEGLKRMNQKERLSVSPEEVIVVEDSVKGIQAAKNAGMSVIGVTNTDSAINLSRAGADLVVKELNLTLFDAIMSASGAEAFWKKELRQYLQNPDWLVFEGLAPHLRRWKEFSANTDREKRAQFIQSVNESYTPEVCKRTLELLEELDSLEATRC